MKSTPSAPVPSEMPLSATVAPIEKSKGFMRFLPTLARILTGLPLLVFGLNGFLNFIPQPTTPMPEGAVAFAGALMKTGYMLQLVAITQAVVGVFLLTNRFVPLALVLFAPFIVNSMAFHFFLEPSGLKMSGVFMVLELYLAWEYRAAYRPLLTARWLPAHHKAGQSHRSGL